MTIDLEHSGLIHEALVAEGFELDRSETEYSKYVGALPVLGIPSDCEIHWNDDSFLRLPKLLPVDDRFKKHSVGHFEQSGYYCYANNGEVVLSKYDPRGAVRSILNMMVEALEHHLSCDLTNEIAAEFPQHWFATSSTYIELPGTSDRSIKLVYAKNDGGRHRLAAEANADHSILGQLIETKQSPAIPSRVVVCNCDLTFLPGQTQPESLGDLVSWANSLEDRLGDRVINAFGRRGENEIDTVFIQAQNATVGMTLDTSDVPPQLLKRKAGLNKMILANSNKIKIAPILCMPVSSDLMFQRNLEHGSKNLTGKRIAILGCGTIGSQLCKLLAQNGAGSSGGELILIDNQSLGTENVGRHWLGPNRIGQSKAIACERELVRMFPQADIRGLNANIVDTLKELEELDLVIDATGEEALSVQVNEWLKGLQLRNEKIVGMFAYLYGNAEAGQVLMVDASDHACFRCIKPRQGQLARYEPRRNPNSIEITPAACGQAPFVPYGVAGSVMVAGLASAAALDWASENLSPRLRTVRVNDETTREVKDVNPKRSEACPFCAKLK